MANETELLHEEIFCLKFELDTLSEVLLRREAERWVPGFIFENVNKDHVDRYEWACNYVRNRSVLDIACGVGKGSYILALSGNAHQITGCDLNPNAIRYAKHRNASDRIEFSVLNALEMQFKNQFDVVVSFETIEHLPDVDIFLKNTKTALKDGGLFLVSTPISEKDIDSKPSNPYHFQEWGFMRFQDVVGKFFQINEVFVQLYPPVYKPKVHPIIQKLKWLFRIRGNTISDQKMESKIERFIDQYPLHEIGRERIGYQLLVCQNSK